jgi:hypothetical protein
MSRRNLAVAAVLTVLLALTANASAAAPKRAVVRAQGQLEFKPNAFLKESYRYRPHVVPIRTGGTLSLVERIGESHTFSVVRRVQRPRNAKQFNACFADSGACIAILDAHGASDGAAPAKPLVNSGAAGFDQPGDSVVLPPRSRGTKVKVTARAGTRLYFMCAIHPQMQGEVAVKK